MPWNQTSPMQQKTLFIADHLRGTRSITELCAEYAISRKTAYKWIERFIRRGPAGLEDHSRRPRRSPNEISAHIVTGIVELRRLHPTWGAKKILRVLQRRHPQWSLPNRSTGFDILNRHGLIKHP